MPDFARTLAFRRQPVNISLRPFLTFGSILYIMLRRLFTGSDRTRTAHLLYAALVGQARLPIFYTRYGVPDSLDGRFELILLHAFLVIRQLSRDPAGQAMAQRLFDIMFADMDRNMRELGVSDVTVGPKIKAMAKGFYGRSAAYTQGLDDPAALDAALSRNLYGTLGDQAAALIDARAAMARYIHLSDAALASRPRSDVLAGRPGFIDPEQGL